MLWIQEFNILVIFRGLQSLQFFYLWLRVFLPSSWMILKPFEEWVYIDTPLMAEHSIETYALYIGQL